VVKGVALLAWDKGGTKLLLNGRRGRKTKSEGTTLCWQFGSNENGTPTKRGKKGDFEQSTEKKKLKSVKKQFELLEE